MSTGLNFLLAVMACCLLSTTVLAVSKRPADVWNFYHFDGTGFVAGPADDRGAFVAVRERAQPVILMNRSASIESIALPEGAGVIAGICYFQSSGGKLATRPGYAPCSRVPLLISAGGRHFVTVQTDEQGYFVSVLSAGTYTIGNSPFTAEISVESGITSLVPLRAGKRMVD